MLWCQNFYVRHKLVRSENFIVKNSTLLDSAVGIVTGYGLDDRGVGVRVPVGARIFTSPYCPDRF
jgi:hypothetical protein